MEDEIKTMYEETVKCPHCKKRIDIKLKKKTIVHPEKGEYKKYLDVEKSKQKTLKEV